MKDAISDQQLVTPLTMFYKWEKEEKNRVYLRQPVNGVYTEYTWGEVANEARSMAAALVSMGVKPGDRVALASKNCAHWFMADFAIMMAGGVSVPLYPNQMADTTRYVLEHSGAKILFTGKFDDPKEMEDGIIPGVTTIGFPYKSSVISRVDHAWDDVVAKHAPIEGKTQHGLDDIMTIIYTSGTTGFPKGVVHTYRSVAFSAGQAGPLFDIGKSDRAVSFLPLSHVAERLLVEMTSVYYCTTISFVESLESFAKNIQEVQPTLFFAVPRLWVKFQMGILAKLPQKKLDKLLKIPVVSGLIKTKLRKALGLNQARLIISGAAPLAKPVMDWFDKIGLEILEGYGLTENFAYSSINRPDKRRKGTVGVGLPNSGLSISERGEILFKSPAVMQGYYKEPEKTAEVINEDGALMTGDKGTVDADGFLKITGRVKEIFKTAKGKYVAPAPIEGLFAENTNIEQLCVMGNGLTQPVAVLVPSEEARQLEPSALKKDFLLTLDRVNKKIESHEKMKQVIVAKEPWTVEDGMMTPTLKIKRHQVEARYQKLASEGGGETVIWEH